MKGICKLAAAMLLALAAIFTFNGCATLAVTPLQTTKTTVAKQPFSLGIQALGGRLQEVLSNSTNSNVNASLGQIFSKVTLLPNETSRKSPEEVQKTYGTDFIYTTSISDVSVAGNLNPIWTATFPLLFFKPLAPIVTFEAHVTLDNSMVDARTSRLILQRQSTAVVTDHFSPMNPQDKVRGLVSRGINNAMVDFLDECLGKMDTGKQ